MSKVTEQHPEPASRGILLHSGRIYDFLAWTLTRGREGAFRARLIELARLKPGESVLDVGSGTGTLAIAAKRRVESTGTVFGIDASPEMTAYASRKARKAGLDVTFKYESINALPFTDGKFDVVMSTLMMHHLPRKLREEGIREIRRVLKPGGRVLIVDFGGKQQQRGLIALLHRRHGHVEQQEVAALLGATGLRVAETGAVGVKDLHYTLATS